MIDLRQGDCLEILPTLEAESFDAVVTDPPYGVDYQSAWRTGSRRLPKIANDKSPFVWWLPAATRLLRPGGCLLCFCRWDVAEAFRLAIGWAGLRVGGQLVWDRVMHGLGDPSSRPAPRHDIVWFAAKGRFRFHGRRPSSVLRETTVNGTQLLHPTQKPLGLIRSLVADYSPPGGLVLDPFAGSGTTAVACALEGRSCVGIEREAAYHDIALRRIEEARRDGPCRCLW